jgi:uncharacterized membrane protein (DUF4010 family)
MLPTSFWVPGRARFSGGIISGLVSSTATTVSYSRRTASEAALAPLGAFVIMTASCISIMRVLVEIAAVAPGKFGEIALPLIGMLVFCCLIAAALFFLSRKQGARMPEQKNNRGTQTGAYFRRPIRSRPAGGRSRKAAFWICGLFVVAVISASQIWTRIRFYGTTCRFQHDRHVDCMAGRPHRSKFLFKFGIVALLGPPGLTQRIGCAFAVALAIGRAILLFWPN